MSLGDTFSHVSEHSRTKCPLETRFLTCQYSSAVGVKFRYNQTFCLVITHKGAHGFLTFILVVSMVSLKHFHHNPTCSTVHPTFLPSTNQDEQLPMQLEDFRTWIILSPGSVWITSTFGIWLFLGRSNRI